MVVYNSLYQVVEDSSKEIFNGLSWCGPYECHCFWDQCTLSFDGSLGFLDRPLQLARKDDRVVHCWFCHDDVVALRSFDLC
jgi:hypothetical protein